MKLYKDVTVENLQRAVGLATILFFEFIGATLFGAYYGDWKQAQGIGGCPAKSVSFGALDWAGLIGVGLIFLWVLRRVLWPKITTDIYKPIIKIGPIIATNPTIPGKSYTFFSNHPSYVFIEAWNIFFVYLFYLPATTSLSAAGCPFARNWIASQMMLAVSVAFPLIRLVGWFVLRRQIKETTRYVIWPAIALFSVCAALIPAFMLHASWVSQRTAQKLPTVNTTTFAGGKDAHPNLMNTPVKVSGTLAHTAPLLCACLKTQEIPCAHTYASKISLEEGGDILLILSGLSDGLTLPLFTGDIGKRVEFFAVLSPMPNAKKEPWKFSDCGAQEFGPFPKAGRVYGEIVTP